MSRTLNQVIIDKYLNEYNGSIPKALGFGFENVFCEMINKNYLDQDFYKILNRPTKSVRATDCEVVRSLHSKTDVFYKTRNRHKVRFSLKNYKQDKISKVKFYSNENLYGLKERFIESGLMWNIPRNLQDDFIVNLFEEKNNKFFNTYKNEIIDYILKGVEFENISWIVLKIEDEIYLYNVKKLYQFLIKSEERFINLDILERTFKKNENTKTQQIKSFHICLNFAKIIKNLEPDYKQDCKKLIFKLKND